MTPYFYVDHVIVTFWQNKDCGFSTEFHYGDMWILKLNVIRKKNFSKKNVP